MPSKDRKNVLRCPTLRKRHTVEYAAKGYKQCAISSEAR